MAKILFNPENGSEIKNFVFKNEHFMDAKEGQAFMPGMVVSVDDDLADFMVDTWGFLQVLTVDQAKEYLDSKEAFQCDKCEFHTKVRIGFEGHKRKHLNETKLDELGIPMITKRNKVEEKDAATIQELRRKDWDKQDRDAGLEGPGLTIDREV